ncbi:MAG TPA: DUF4082 domain-containing protein, partial [Patescibacteria group bacterium]|nr:DUF4082 domain-containing protein [Patescibacteria group bacterium]
MMQTSRKVRRFTAAIAATTLVLGFLPLFSGNQHASAADGQTLFTNQTPTTVNNTDGTNVNYELGMRFQPAVNGQITAIRFWKSSKETGTHTGRIWNASGTQLASVVFSGETASGWQEQALATPLSVSANAEYTVSVNTGKTYYADTVNGLASKITNGDLSSVAGDNGRFGSPGTYPTTSWQNSNYFRDVRFAAAAAAAPAINSFSISPQSLTAGQSATLSWSVTGAPAPSISI